MPPCMQLQLEGKMAIDLEPCRKHGYSLASAACLLLAVVLMAVSAGGWDITGSKGTFMQSELCDHNRVIPDGKDLFQQAPWKVKKLRPRVQVCGAGGTERPFSGVHNHVDKGNSSAMAGREVSCSKLTETKLGSGALSQKVGAMHFETPGAE